MLVSTFMIIICNSYKPTSGKFTVRFYSMIIFLTTLKLQSRLGDHTYATENDSLRISQIPDKILIFLALCIDELSLCPFYILKMMKSRHTILGDMFVTDGLAC